MARVLLIDDEDLSRFGVRRALESGGHEVFEASDGEEGVSEFKMMAASGKNPRRDHRRYPHAEKEWLRCRL